MVNCYEKILEINAAQKSKNLDGQLDMFSSGDHRAPSGFEYPNIPELPLREKLNLEKESAGIYLSGHMLDEYGGNLEALAPARISDIIESFDDEDDGISTARYHEKELVTVAGIVTKKVIKNTKNGDGMAFVTLEDRSGEIELVVFPRALGQYGGLLGFDSAVYASGEISVKDDENPKLLVRTINALTPDSQFARQITRPAERDQRAEASNVRPEPQSTARTIQPPTGQSPTEQSPIAQSNPPQTLYLRVDSMDCPAFRRALAVTEIFEGGVPVIFYDMSAKKYIRSNVRTAPTIFVQTELSELLGRQNVVLR